MSMFTKSIKMFHENHSVESYAKKWGHLLKIMSIRKAVMVLAHRIRKFAAEKHGCKASEISFAECLRMAWVEMKAAEKRNEIPTNEKGFVIFKNRNWDYNGDKNTWVRVDGDKLTVNIGKGIISSGYMEELESFLAAYDLRITTGRVSVAL